MQLRFDLVVDYEDGDPVEVTAGQREMAQWEAEAFGCSASLAMDQKAMTFMRYLAWAALRRRHYPEKFPTFGKWSETVLTVAPKDDEEDEQAPDPTRPDPSSED
ncbi:MAG TPA: hypothetical protein VMU51_34260 [Mycobacteriales bacterium]|nr:hypothetical protein [Mycobacteriales bacterium]